MDKMDRNVRPKLNAPAARSGGMDLDAASSGFVDPSGAMLELEKPGSQSSWHEQIQILREVFKEGPERVLWAGPKNETRARIQMLDQILTALAAQQLSSTWLISGNRETMFKGQTPFEYCVSGRLPAMRDVLVLLKGWIQGQA